MNLYFIWQTCQFINKLTWSFHTKILDFILALCWMCHVIILYCRGENLQIWDYFQEEINLKGSCTDHKSTIQLTIFSSLK